MNIQAQVCALVIVFLVMLFYFSGEKIGLNTEKIFSHMLVVSTISMLFDILSVFFIVYEEIIGQFWVTVVCKAYLVTILLVGFIGFDYALAVIFENDRFKKIIPYLLGLLAIQSVVIFAVPISWYHEGRIVYSYNLSAIFTFAFTLFYIFATYLIINKKDSDLTVRRRSAMAVWLMVWIAAGIVQFIFKEFLLVSFAMAIGVLTIFFVLENPETLKDRRYGCFNSHALLLYLQQRYEKGEDCGLIGFNFDRVDRSGESYSFRKEALKRMVEFLNNFPDCKKFKNVGGEIIVVTTGADENTLICRKFKEAISEMPDIFLSDKSKSLTKMSVIVMNDCRKVRGPEDLFRLENSLKSKMPASNSIIFAYVEDEDIEAFNSKNDVIEEINGAIDNDRIEVFYQPIYSNGRKEITCCEALARIRKEDGSILSPGVFIPVAEETGLINQIGESVFEKVCKFIYSGECDRLGIDYIEVNLSIAQVESVNIANKYISIMERYDIDPSKINLEITETVSILTKEKLLENMRRLIEYGIHFSLDDFGKGRSNLMYMVDMPVSIIKLDMDIVKAYFKEDKAKSVISGMIKMAHGMGLKIVAEGVESKEELAAMQNEEVDYIQGFYFSKPLPKDDFLKYVQNYD